MQKQSSMWGGILPPQKIKGLFCAPIWSGGLKYTLTQTSVEILTNWILLIVTWHSPGLGLLFSMPGV